MLEDNYGILRNPLMSPAHWALLSSARQPTPKATAQQEPTQGVTCGLALKGQLSLPILYKEPDYVTQEPTGQEVTVLGTWYEDKKGELSLEQMKKLSQGLTQQPSCSQRAESQSAKR